MKDGMAVQLCALMRLEQGLLRASPWGDWWSAGARSPAFFAEGFARANPYPTLVAACHRCVVTQVAVRHLRRLDARAASGGCLAGAPSAG